MTLHVFPLNDWIEHDINCTASECECLCDPNIHYVDAETGLPLEVPLVIHNAVDGRE